MFEIVYVLILPLMLLMYYAIRCLVVHHSAMGVKLLMYDLIVEDMHNQGRIFDS